MKHIIFGIKTISVILFLTTPLLTFAQGPGFDDDVVDTPFDGGASLVLAVAAGYGATKLANRKKT